MTESFPLMFVSDRQSASPFAEVHAAYVHVPFCIHRCGYCDFTVIAGRDDLMDTYLDCLELELQSKLPAPHPVRTLFLGGGTPSYLPAAQMERLFSILKSWLPLESDGEFSMECNPDGLSDDRMAVMQSAGVNRVSLGVQSFQAEHLRTLERAHSPDEVVSVVARLRKHQFKNVSLDLIFGVPDQTLPEWKETLSAAVSVMPQHISTYGLTFEKGTSFWSRLQKDQIQPVTEELERDMYAEAMSFLPGQGFRQYELSNFAKPGFECRHNQVYWRGESFFGFGPGAAEFINGTRNKNHQSVIGWIQRLRNGQSPVQDVDQLSPDLLAREAIMVGLRQIEGINLEAFATRYQQSVRDLAPEEFDRLIASKLLECDNGFIRLTPEGRFLADTVMSEFF
ncbi:radical SAM family heme chaperone HemW [Planctomicrobium sp. SH527]|uniref:radical SAM family heme chaperone HemW n=1 Tax=Planctomicrobium sp. SH527 TaxID=3448123 RepID=UPI003F5C5046